MTNMNTTTMLFACVLALGCGPIIDAPPLPDAGDSPADAGVEPPDPTDGGPEEPEGYLVEGSWLVDGEAPSEARCAAKRIDQVQLLITTEAAEPVRTLVGRCEDGMLRDTDPLPWLVTYRGEWVALDAEGGVLQRIPIARAIEPAWPREQLEVVTASFEVRDPTPGDWDLRARVDLALTDGEGASITEDRCAAAGVQTIRLTLRPERGDAVVTDIPCGNGELELETGPLLSWEQRYYPSWQALSATDEVIHSEADRYIEIPPPTRTVYNYRVTLALTIE